MNDDLGPLRQAMSDLAEHGGTTDLYERSLHRSRQLRRRTTVAAGAAAMAVLVAVGGAVVLTGAQRPGPPLPVASQPPAPTVTTRSASPSAAPATTAPSSEAPSSATPSSKAPPPRPPSTAPTSKRPRYPDCPSAKTLERLADLPEDWSYVPSSVECWRNWATADPEGPVPGDGFSLFRYRPETGWRHHSDGSGYHCADLGITSGNPPFCSMG